MEHRQRFSGVLKIETNGQRPRQHRLGVCHDLISYHYAISVGTMLAYYTTVIPLRG